jgi:hypothetical protein
MLPRSATINQLTGGRSSAVCDGATNDPFHAINRCTSGDSLE